MSFGNFLSGLAPVAAGFLAGPGATALLAGAATGAGIASLRGEDPLMGAVTGGLGGYGGGQLGGAAMGSAPATAGAGGATSTTSGINALAPTKGTIMGGATPSATVGPLGAAQSTATPTYSATTAAKNLFTSPGNVISNLGGGDMTTGALKAGAIGLPAIGGAMVPDMTTADMNKEKYDPTKRLNLNRNTGLRLLAQGGYIEDRHPTLSRTPPGELTEEEINYFYDLDEDEVSDRMYLNRLHREKMQKYIDEYDMSPRGQLETIIENLKKPPRGIEKLFDSMTKDKEGMREGGYLETGMGDGVSDEIPASIDGEQDVLLSENEFVIPADVVSGLGNGSSDAGAEKLFNMMDRVRKARTGTKKMGKEINAERLMPA
tara:strand:+ start:877 stop:2001 length:1125 start_codon:yes stop_codon:yes gene_type:complete